MFEIKINAADGARIASALAGIAHEIPKVMEISINGTAGAVKRGIVAEMRSVFDRPTPKTLNSLFIKPATAGNLQAMVWIKDGDKTGVDHAKWLRPQIFGGGRSVKGSESLLRRAGLMWADQYLVPSKYAPSSVFDERYGNVRNGLINQMLSGLSANRDLGVKSNITKRSAARNKTRAKFYIVGGKADPRGVGMRASDGQADLLFWFVRKPTYKRRLDFFGVGQRIIDVELPARINRSLSQTISYHARNN